MKIAAQYLERGGAHDPTSQLAGAVNGAGSVGAVLEGLLIGAITAMLGWDGFMMFIVAMSLLSFGVMFRASRAFASK